MRPFLSRACWSRRSSFRAVTARSLLSMKHVRLESSGRELPRLCLQAERVETVGRLNINRMVHPTPEGGMYSYMCRGDRSTTWLVAWTATRRVNGPCLIDRSVSRTPCRRASPVRVDQFQERFPGSANIPCRGFRGSWGSEHDRLQRKLNACPHSTNFFWLGVNALDFLVSWCLPGGGTRSKGVRTKSAE